MERIVDRRSHNRGDSGKPPVERNGERAVGKHTGQQYRIRMETGFSGYSAAADVFFL